MKKIALFLTIIFSAFLSQAQNEKMEAFVDDIATQVIKIASNKDYSISAKTSHFKKLMEKNFDTEWMAKFAIGRLYKSLDEKQKAEYLNQYETYLLYSYLPNLLRYTDESFKIINTEQSGKRNFAVHTEIIRKDGKPPVKTTYIIRPIDDDQTQFKIIDIVVEGISTIMSERSEFKEITTNSGADHLIKLLANKNAKLAAQYS